MAGPIPNPDKEPTPDGRLIAPDEGGLTNYRSPSFDPKTGLFVVSAKPSYCIYFSKPADGTYGWSGADYSVWSKAVLEAIDYKTGEIRWEHELGPGRCRSRRPDNRVRPHIHRGLRTATCLHRIPRTARRCGMPERARPSKALPLPMSWMDASTC